MEENQNPKQEMSFVQHLDALRWHIIRGLVAALIFTVVAFVFKEILVDRILLGPTNPSFPTYGWLCDLSEKLDSPALCITDLPEVKNSFINRKLSGQFTMHITIALIAGIILAFPYIFWEFWRFVKPALYNVEKRTTRGTVAVVSLLFFIGVLFGYYVIAPLTYNFFVNYSLSEHIENKFDFSSYFKVIGNLTLVCGIMFQLPVAVYFLSKIGIVSPKGMIKKRKMAVIVILFLSAVFTPADVFSQLLVAFPLFLLYQLSIFISRIVHKKYEKRMKQQA